MPDELVARLLRRERDAVSEALNLVDDRRPERRERALRLLDALERETAGGGGSRVGITGAPGAGKSTLLDALVRRVRARDETLGIIAVDPSSQRTGGALLGDRIRMRSGGGDPGVFLRSMAARTRLGGLADATHAGLVVLTAAFDRVFVETVGVGQSEAEVAQVVDTLAYVAQPGAGDLLQFMKAGILELPDVVVVNKADTGAAARRTAQEIEAGLGLGEARADGWRVPVLCTSARDGEGVAELLDALDAHGRHLRDTDGLRERRLRGRTQHVLEALTQRYGTFGLDRIGGRKAVSERVAASGDASAFGLILELSGEIEDALRKP